MNALDPVEVEEAVTAPEAFIVRNSLPCRLSDLTGKTWKIQIKDIYMTDTVSFCLEKERRSTSLQGVHADNRTKWKQSWMIPVYMLYLHDKSFKVIRLCQPLVILCFCSRDLFKQITLISLKSSTVLSNYTPTYHTFCLWCKESRKQIRNRACSVVLSLWVLDLFVCVCWVCSFCFFLPAVGEQCGGKPQCSGRSDPAGVRKGSWAAQRLGQQCHLLPTS